MGADGGIGWVRVKDRELKQVYIDWILPYVTNSCAYAYGGEFVTPITDEPDWEDRIEGAYGTDCSTTLGGLCESIEFILDKSEHWSSLSGSDEIRTYTFAELIQAIQTDPDPELKYKSYSLSNPWAQIEPLFMVARDMAFDDRYKIIPDEILTMTLKEWAAKASEAIDTSCWYCTETWT